MEIKKLLIIIFGLVAGICLASIQLRRIFKRELPSFGADAFKKASKIDLDTFDKRMIMVSGISFSLCIICLVAHYW